MKYLRVIVLFFLLSTSLYAQTAINAKKVFHFRRGYKNGYPIFQVKFEGTTYSGGSLAKLSEKVTKCKSTSIGIFDPTASAVFTFGASKKTFSFNPINFIADSPAEILTELKSRLIKIKQWRNSLNTVEDFEITI